MTRFLSDRTDATDSFFRAFKADSGAAAEDYLVVALGDDEATADEGLRLVRLGITRATAAPASDFGEAVPLPKVGDHAILLDGRDNPRCVWQTTEVVTKPFASVDDAFAHDAGALAGRDSWLAEKRDLFARRAEAEGSAFDDETEMVFLRFRIVWPRLFADRPPGGGNVFSVVANEIAGDRSTDGGQPDDT